MQRDMAPIGAARTLDLRPVQLHVVHDLGGGTAKWLQDFSLADTARVNLVLKSLAEGEAWGAGVALYGDATDEVPLRVWKFEATIHATIAAHPEYRRILDAIIAEYRVGALLVSSLIGHSLEVLDTGLPTVVVTHDYFPYCPAINIHFGGVCRACDDKRIAECYRDNPDFNPFVKFLPAERALVRGRYLDLVRRPNVTMATPSRSVEENLVRLNGAFREAAFHTVPHGYGRPLRRIDTPVPAANERLRILVLGQLAMNKGSELLRGALGAVSRFADIWLLGAREVGEQFKYEPSVHVVGEYELDDLPVHVANINPHLALLTSIVPETFNYALTELQMLGVPAAATRVGSFPERIGHGETGYLFEPDIASLVGMLGSIDADRETLARIRANIGGYRPRSAEEMVADYHRIVPIAPPAPREEAAPPPASPGTDPAVLTQAMTISNMWKEARGLHTRLTIVNEARQHEQHMLSLKRSELEEAQRTIERKEALLAERDGKIQALASHLEMKNAQVAEFLASTSWKVSSPVRVVGRAWRAVKSIAGNLEWLFGDPQSLPKNLEKLSTAWRSGGWAQFRHALHEIKSTKSREHAWDRYRRAWRKDVRPRLVARVCELQRHPLISLAVATYNPNEDMLRQMLNSVRAQLYSNWELCIADDGSTEDHVRKVLLEYAAADKRIKVHIGGENRGVSHALNRALAMVSGDFVVLCDHDDLLEEQAILRFAESVLDDDPDMVYADEALVEANADIIRRYAYRPAFSLALLRSHPYIVHPVGFRTKLLRELGGFDESLTISQDYDLILRVVEKARTIVHVPEILYRWRIHGSSAGLQKMHQVMDTSRSVLQRHLERCGEQGTVDEGPSFNLFDVRHPLAAGLKVAIVIPTRNHGQVLRNCIESLWRTVTGVPYDIVVVDHESDDEVTLDYLKTVREAGARVLRYEGKFNFSAINNFAVAKLGPGYSHYLFCNNDIEALAPGWLERMLELAQQPDIGIVGAKLMYPDRETIQHAGVCVGAFGAAEHYGKRNRNLGDVEPGFSELLVINREVAAVTAACMLIRSQAFEEIGGFDEAIAVGFGDVDLCLRAGERGYRVVYCPSAELVHHESLTRGTSTRDPHPEDSALFLSKWRSLLQAGDPYYSPGLSLLSTVWGIKLPLHVSHEVRRRIVQRDRKTGREKRSYSPR